jgi:microsomal dipeptidase-like Zn-dependent dipeptidase
MFKKIIEVGDKTLETKAKNEEKLREENRQASLRRIGYRMRYAPLNSYVENLIDQMEISPDYETIEVLEKWKSDIEEYHEQVVAGLETMKKEFQDHLINISDYASLYTQLNSLRGKLAAFVRMLVLVINRKNKPSDDTPRSYEDLGGESA